MQFSNQVMNAAGNSFQFRVVGFGERLHVQFHSARYIAGMTGTDLWNNGWCYLDKSVASSSVVARFLHENDRTLISTHQTERLINKSIK